jgi:predicted nuclease of predicted toxin-antitoxin system
LRKRSAASSIEKPLEGVTFLVEESLGPSVAEKLKRAGFGIVSQGEKVPTGISDQEVFAIASVNNWVVLSKDFGTRYRPAEK